jgi:hypothetical protein
MKLNFWKKSKTLSTANDRVVGYPTSRLDKAYRAINRNCCNVEAIEVTSPITNKFLDMFSTTPDISGLESSDVYKIIDAAKDFARKLANDILSKDLDSIDQSEIPTHQCFNCGSNIFLIQATFDDYEMGLLWPTGTCTGCDSIVGIPVPWEHPNWDPEFKEITHPLPPVDD